MEFLHFPIKLTLITGIISLPVASVLAGGCSSNYENSAEFECSYNDKKCLEIKQKKNSQNLEL